MKGTFVTADGAEQYTGQWKSSLRHGHGVHFVKNLLMCTGGTERPRRAHHPLQLEPHAAHAAPSAHSRHCAHHPTSLHAPDNTIVCRRPGQLQDTWKGALHHPDWNLYVRCLQPQAPGSAHTGQPWLTGALKSCYLLTERDQLGSC